MGLRGLEGSGSFRHQAPAGTQCVPHRTSMVSLLFPAPSLCRKAAGRSQEPPGRAAPSAGPEKVKTFLNRADLVARRRAWTAPSPWLVNLSERKEPRARTSRHLLFALSTAANPSARARGGSSSRQIRGTGTCPRISAHHGRAPRSCAHDGRARCRDSCRWRPLSFRRRPPASLNVFKTKQRTK